MIGRAALGALLLCWAGAGLAQSTPEAQAWLEKIHRATMQLSYRGTFVYQHAGHTETSRITRFTDRHGDIEKLEVLDGVPREILRTRDAVKCYLPESHTLRIDRRGARRAFPRLLPADLGELAASYELSLGSVGRIAGFDCQEVLLKPRDDMRYGYQLCADTKTGMLLKARIVDAKGDTVEQFSFTQLSIGGVTRDQVRARHTTAKWHVEDADAEPADFEAHGWTFGGGVPGFRKVAEVQRRIRSSRSVGQVVYSDGLAAVSLFIEPMHERKEAFHPGLSSMGAVHMYSRRVGDYVVTAVGETPAASVQKMADSVEYRGAR